MGTLLTYQNLVIALSLIGAVYFLRSGIVKQLIDNLKQLGSVQESLLKAKELENVALQKELDETKVELLEERAINRRLRRHEEEDEVPRKRLKS